MLRRLVPLDVSRGRTRTESRDEIVEECIDLGIHPLMTRVLCVELDDLLGTASKWDSRDEPWNEPFQFRIVENNAVSLVSEQAFAPILV